MTYRTSKYRYRPLNGYGGHYAPGSFANLVSAAIYQTNAINAWLKIDFMPSTTEDRMREWRNSGRDVMRKLIFDRAHL